MGVAGMAGWGWGAVGRGAAAMATAGAGWEAAGRATVMGDWGWEAGGCKEGCASVEAQTAHAAMSTR